MTHQLIHPLIASVCDVLSMMTQTACGQATDTSDTIAQSNDCVVGSISISGDLNAKVDLIFPCATGDTLVQRMTGQSELTPQTIDDALGELCNMIVGSAKSSLSLDDANLSCPVMSRDASIASKSDETDTNSNTITMRFDSEAGPFSLILKPAA